MAARSTHVTLENRAGILNLRRTEMRLAHGEWTVEPPLLIGDRGEWESESSGILTGTEGRVTYQIEDLDEVRVGEVRLHWNNPFVGSNSYHESVDPAAADETDTGFSVVHVGGSGNNANVTFKLLSGFCTVHRESGEIVCTTAEMLTNESQRYAAIWEQTRGPSWHALHGLSAARYQQTFNELVGQGFRPVQVSGYSLDGEDRYAAIFEQREGPPFDARHRLSAAEYQQTFNELVGQGFRPVQVSGYSLDGEDRYAAIFEQREGPPFDARHRLSAAEYQQTFNELVGQGFRPVQVNGYSLDGEDRYAAIFEQREGPPFDARHRLSAAEYQQTFNELVGQGFRPVQVNGYSLDGEDRYAAIFEQREGPPFDARHRLSAAEYQQTFNELVGQGFRLVQVSGYSID